MNSHEEEKGNDDIQDSLSPLIEREILNNTDYEDKEASRAGCSFSQWRYHGITADQNSQEENSEVSLLDATKPKIKQYHYNQKENHDSMNLTDDIPNALALNNNVVNKSNLQCQNEKHCCCYMNFPLKVNNNIYPEKAIPKKDGMEEYFRQFSSKNSQSPKNDNVHLPSAPSSSCSDCSKSINGLREVNYDTLLLSDQINPLNGDEIDEDDGCIYTYKGDNFASNFSHLLQTCFSCGLPLGDLNEERNGSLSIQRVLNGSSQSNPIAHNDLYSPEMDFLEMDFDPGSNGDGGESDCDDNNSSPNIALKPGESISLEKFTLEHKSRLEKEKNNIPSDIRSLMCRRCELSLFNEGKVNNTHSVKQISDCLSSNDLLSNLTDLHPSKSSFSGISKNPINIDVKVNSFSSPNHSLNFPVNGFRDEIKVQEEENNLSLSFDHYCNGESLSAKHHCNRDSSEDEDADDESGDDCTRSPSLTQTSTTCHNFQKHYGHNSLDRQCLKLRNSMKNKKQIRFLAKNDLALTQSSDRCNLDNASFTAANSSDNNDLVQLIMRNVKVTNGASNENNNLGSISAPEVSPSKDFSPLENFSRSISFHNQLSSPKYENVCFSQPYRENVLSSLRNGSSSTSDRNGRSSNNCGHTSSSCTHNFNSEYSNLDACVDRLCQRERSVFNITSSVNPITSDSSSVFVANSSASVSTTSPVNHVEHSNNDEEQNTLGLRPSKVLPPKIKMTDPAFCDPNVVLSIDVDEGLLPDDVSPHLEKVMIWTERQATFKQIPQHGASTCGPTAVLNALLAFGHSKSIEEVSASIKARKRAEGAPLVPYLLSRSCAGTTHNDLIKGIESVSEGSVKGRFFKMFPKRAFQLSRWLASWIKKGAVPVATLNLQVGVPHGQTIPDAWHHQMVFGVGPQGVYLTNPLECVSDSLLADQLCSDSILLVRRSDITSRWDQMDRLIHLSLQGDPRWNEMNVLGQVVCVLKEDAAPEVSQGRRHLTSHVAIPALYHSGVTIFVRSDNTTCLHELMEASELPILD